MNEEEFCNAVKAMREMQVKYFRTKNVIVLKKAKALEKKVDLYIKENIYVKEIIKKQEEEINELFSNC